MFKKILGGDMKVIVVGSSGAALSFVDTLRKGSDMEIVMVGKENVEPYFRPTLSHMLLSEKEEERFFLKPKNFYQENNITLKLGNAVKHIDSKNKNITLDNGEKITYDKLVMAVGSENFIPPIEGAQKLGVFNLKYYEDLLSINEYAKDKNNVTIIGGGLLGIEAAWAFHNAGKKVTILEFAPRLMARQLGEKASAKVEQELEKNGIKVLTGKSTKKILGQEHVEKILLESGEEIPTELLFFSIGVRPNLELGKTAELKTDRGILIDNAMKTSDEDIYAIGDCAQMGQMVPGIWPLATQMGKIAANDLLGKTMEMAINPPIAILKALDLGVYSAGDISLMDDSILVEDGDDIKYFTFKDGFLTGVNLIGNTKLSSKIPKMLMGKTTKTQIEELLKEK